MATILEFREPERSQPTRAARSRTRSSAEVIIFPGVHIERWTTAPSDPAPVKKPKPMRDLLEIE